MSNCNILLSDPQDCSIGQIIWPLDESNRINSRFGTYFLPDEVSCNGRLVSVHTCFFYNDKGNRNNTDFKLRVGVFRRIGDSYIRDDWINIDVTRQNSSETQACTSINLSLPVQAGDWIAVRLQRPNRMPCPLQPILYNPKPTSVFFIRSNAVTIPVSQVMATQSHTNVHLDVRASIGKLTVSHGNTYDNIS